MKLNKTSLFSCAAAALVFCAQSVLVGCSSTRQDIGSTESASPSAKTQDHDFKLPPGWTEADMQACMSAGMPGPMHEKLAKSAGRWSGKCTMWMGPGGEAMDTTTNVTITPVMDGRYTKWEFGGDMPGMGPYQGLGFNGYDNVAQKFVSTWIDNHGSGIMVGEGVLSSDGKTLTWTYSYNCPITKQRSTMREIHKFGDDTLTMDTHAKDPKSGKEYQMMHIELKRQSS